MPIHQTRTFTKIAAAFRIRIAIEEGKLAYSDEKRRFWQIDLSTRAGARSATHQASIAGFVMCAMAVLGMALFGGIAGYTTPEGISAMIGAGLEAIVGLVAGFRFRSEKGIVWGSVAAFFMAIEAIFKLASLSITGAFISVGLGIFLINGVRGALAIRREFGFDDDHAEVFE